MHASGWLKWQSLRSICKQANLPYLYQLEEQQTLSFSLQHSEDSL